MPLVAHLGGRNAADGAGGQEAAREIEDLALAVLGGLAVQDDGAGLHQAGGIAQRGRSTDFGQQVAFGLSLRVALEAAGQQAAQHRAFGRDAGGAGGQRPGRVWRQR
jgi:hypothetical protein